MGMAVLRQRRVAEAVKDVKVEGPGAVPCTLYFIQNLWSWQGIFWHWSSGSSSWTRMLISSDYAVDHDGMLSFVCAGFSQTQSRNLLTHRKAELCSNLPES